MYLLCLVVKRGTKPVSMYINPTKESTIFFLPISLHPEQDEEQERTDQVCPDDFDLLIIL